MTAYHDKWLKSESDLSAVLDAADVVFEELEAHDEGGDIIYPSEEKLREVVTRVRGKG